MFKNYVEALKHLKQYILLLILVQLIYVPVALLLTAYDGITTVNTIFAFLATLVIYFIIGMKISDELKLGAGKLVGVSLAIGIIVSIAKFIIVTLTYTQIGEIFVNSFSSWIALPFIIFLYFVASIDIYLSLFSLAGYYYAGWRAGKGKKEENKAKAKK